MFAVIYRGYLKEGMQDVYKEKWHTIADYFIDHCGALGSCLHQADDGMWLAYSRWPSKAIRDEAWPQDQLINDSHPGVVSQAILELKQCLDPDRVLPNIEMTVVDDLLTKLR